LNFNPLYLNLGLNYLLLKNNRVFQEGVGLWNEESIK